MNFFDEMKRRNVLRAAVLYIGAAWALAQGGAQLLPFFGVPDWGVRWIVVAAAIGFPFWIALAWFYEFTPQGLKRESEIATSPSAARAAGRKLDRWIMAVLALAVVLLLTDLLVPRKGGNSATETIPFESIAVLPMVNASDDKDQQYFSDGLSEDLITTLSQFAGLKVISRNSAFRFRDTDDDAKTIGAKLGVAHLLEGSVQRAGDVVRVTAELIDAADGSTVWSQHYDQPYKDLFKLQDDITRAVAEALKAKLLRAPGAAAQTDRPPSGNLDAYNDYLRAKYYDQQGGDASLRKAIDYYNAAVRIDPHYALAYATMSGGLVTLAGDAGGPQAQQYYAKARDAANSALELDPNLAFAHLARGYLLYSADFDWSGAQAEYQQALQLAPNNGSAKTLLAGLLATLGQTERAIELTKEALLTDPMNGYAYGLLAGYYEQLGRLDEAEQAIRTKKSLGSQFDIDSTMTVLEILRGNADAALKYASRIPAGPWHAISMAMALSIGHDRAAADAALKTVIDNYADGGPFQIAEIYALRKQPDKMFEWLDRAWTRRDSGIADLLKSPFLLRYKDDPRFAAFCRKVGLPPPGTLPGATSSTAAGS